MPQLIKITAIKALDLNFKCPYQANVIKIFEMSNNITGKIILSIKLF